MKKIENQKMLLRFVDREDERIISCYGDHTSLVSLIRTLVDSGIVFVTGSYIQDIKEDDNNPL